MYSVQMVCLALGLIGFIEVIRCCTLPQWKVAVFMGINIMTIEEIQQGLWTYCVKKSTGQQQCKVYDSLVQLPSDLQAARVMTIISCALCGLSLLILFFGADFTTCVQNEDAKPKLSLVAGVGLLLAGLLVIIPVSWSAHSIVKKRELGVCIYIGWTAGVLMILAGAPLCCFSRHKSSSSGGTAKYCITSASAPNENYV